MASGILNESILHKDGIELLVEETIFENELAELKTSVDTNVKDIIDKAPEDQNTPEFIDLRNSDSISSLIGNNFLPDILSSFGKDILDKKIPYDHAAYQLYKINTILGTNYEIKDIFKNAVYIKDDDSKIFIKYDGVDLNIINEFRNKLERSLDCIYDCLYNDLYDKSILQEYLPKVMIIQSLENK